jgi:benzodiazapine receptor
MSVMSIFGERFELIPVLVIAGVVIAIAVFGGLATDVQSHWYETLRKPSWQPPGYLFGPVWTTLYILLIISASIAWHSTSGQHRTSIMILYALNGALNLAWSFIFFRSRSPLVAGMDIIGVLLSILWIMVRVWPISPLAAGLLIPYLLWVAFATVLNWTIVRMN